ncbi:Endonuclease/Exonuclease/phosphatase family protein [Tritrichomonas foetus]|uniref:Endonuclease/Exonuclease/phosphatase family protein n=1 Tax=Tritrichomonas foetus TaxID=1144522 RepID=A0A1J4JMS1_9EUKA|nr:Endonuclease/Exonuclease/phosphatase family protein [Tritrichomonas foetus]|eukprot:OHS99993.1 Endonuclease/Exonuclease/phosphatase family protein [Tritrichomonas foetus]
MQAALQDTQEWFKSTTVKLPHKDKKITFSILLKDYSLKDSYLYIIDESNNTNCFIPISAEVTSAFSYQESKLFLKFFNYDCIVIPFVFEKSIELELMVSHFGKSSILFNGHDDLFMNENISFLKSIAPPEEVQMPPGPQYIAETTLLFPIILDDKARKIWEERTLTLNSSFYIKEVPIRINYLTWNVASKSPTSEVLDDLSKIFSTPVAPADIVVIALEEIEMSVKSVVTGNSHNCEKWTESIKNATSMNNNEQFDVVQYQSMGGVYCCGLVRHSLAPLISQSSLHVKKLGANGMLANKAAVIFRWRIGLSSFSAICCHLAAHDQNWEQRNTQWHEIVEGLKEDDYISFMGDLNYRINTTYEDCISKVKEERDLKYLYGLDQLHETQTNDKIIGSFIEPEIKFNPTFKYDMGVDQYDTSPKHRVPSWTDRILIKTAKPKMRIGLEDELIFETDAACNYIKEQSLFQTDWKPETSPLEFNYPRPPKSICYRSLKCSFSDHRPVHAAYKFPIPFVDEERKKFLQEIISAKYEEMKSISTGNISCDKTQIVFNSQEQEELQFSNMSLVWARWTSKVPKGFAISPKNGMIPASGKCNVILKQITAIPPNYNDTLVITVDGGCRLVINVKSPNGSCAPTNRPHSMMVGRKTSV